MSWYKHITKNQLTRFINEFTNLKACTNVYTINFDKKIFNNVNDICI